MKEVLRVIKEDYQVMGNKTTICLITLTNGFEVVGTSACVDASKFDVHEGRKWARLAAMSKVEEFLGFLACSAPKEVEDVEVSQRLNKVEKNLRELEVYWQENMDRMKAIVHDQTIKKAAEDKKVPKIIER